MRKIKIITIVLGQTSCHKADYREWMVKAFLHRESAEKLVKKLNSVASTLNKKYNSREEEKQKEIMKETGDPSFQLDTDGTTYFIETVELEDA